MLAGKLADFVKRKEAAGGGVQPVGDTGENAGAKPADKVAEKRTANISEVLKPVGTRSSISDGIIFLAGVEIVDLEATERFRILRAQIERENVASGHKYQVIAVTSATPGEGKSVVAANLARAFGADPRGRTLLIDCDLRKSSTHKFFSQPQSPGLSDVLISGKPLRNIIRPVEAGLDLITAGSPVVDSTRTLEQPGLALMLEELKKHYRYILLDCPPILFCPEPLSLTHIASGTLIVARAWRTQRKLVKEAIAVVGKSKVIGMVMNECTDTLKQYGYYGYYGYDKESVARARLRSSKRSH